VLLLANVCDRNAKTKERVGTYTVVYVRGNGRDHVTREARSAVPAHRAINFTSWIQVGRHPLERAHAMRACVWVNSTHYVSYFGTRAPHASRVRGIVRMEI
jgi:hypothetical protein